MPSLLIIPALLSVAIAQTTTISVPFFGFDNFTVQASVVSVKPSATVLALACPSNADECGLFPQQILTYGPSTYVMDMSEPGDEDFTMTQDCSIASSTALCKESASGSEANFPGSSTETYDVSAMAVVITAGVDKLAAGADATATADGSSKQSTSIAASTGGSVDTTSAAPTQSKASGSGSNSAAPAEHTGAAHSNMASNLGLFGAAAGVFAGLMI